MLAFLAELHFIVVCWLTHEHFPQRGTKMFQIKVPEKRLSGQIL
jgi:hypothetical protein